MSDCFECDTITSENKGGVLCIIKRNRKYLIGGAVGVVLAFVILKVMK